MPLKRLDWLERWIVVIESRHADQVLRVALGHEVCRLDGGRVAVIAAKAVVVQAMLIARGNFSLNGHFNYAGRVRMANAESHMMLSNAGWGCPYQH